MIDEGIEMGEACLRLEPQEELQDFDHLSSERPLVAFDFDGTLTVRDSFTAFLAWRAGPLNYALGLTKLAAASVAYLLHRDRGRLKAAALSVFLKGVSRADREHDARAFAEHFNHSLLRPDALATWRRWRAKGARMVIVTASPEILVAPFARALGADWLLGTNLVFDPNGNVVGVLDGKNCRGEEKVARLKALFGPEVRLAAAYGDTSGDAQMLAMADEKGFRVFKGRP